MCSIIIAHNSIGPRNNETPIETYSMKKTWQKLDQKEAFGTIVNTEDPKQYIAMHFSPKLYGSLLAHKALCGHWHRDPVATHMSAFLYQYWY